MKNNMKKITSIAIAALITVGSTGSYAASFSDISNHWAKDYIEKGYQLGLIKGSEGKFNPNDSMTKIEAISLSARLLNLPKAEIDKAVMNNKHLLMDESFPTWAIEDFSIALSRNIIDPSILNKLHVTGNKAATLSTREEVAIFLARAIGLEGEARSMGNNVDLKFADTNTITPDAKGYVYVMSKNNIINGGDGNKFNPKLGVKRGEMAKLLSESHRYVKENEKKSDQLVKVSGTIYSINSINNKNYIIVSDSMGKNDSYEVDGQTILTIDNNSARFSDLLQGALVNLEVSVDQSGNKIIKTLSANNLIEKHEGVLYDLNERSRTLTIEENITNYRRTLTLSQGVETFINGNKAYVYDLKTKDNLSLETKNGEVVKIYAEANVRDLKGVLKEINRTDQYIIIEDKEGNRNKYDLDKELRVERDGVRVGLDELRRGDDVQIHIENKKVLRIDAKKVEKIVEGIIEGKNIRLDKREITIKNNKTDKSETYSISENVNVILEGKRAKIDDLRVGDYAEIKLEGEEVVEVKGQAIQLNDKHIGTISSMGTNYLVLRFRDGKTINVVVNDRVLRDENGYRLELKEGNEVLITGEIYRGEILAEKIMKI